MKNRLLSNALGLVLIAGVGAAVMTVLRPGTLMSANNTVNTQAKLAQALSAQASAAHVADEQLVGNYNGPVTLKFTLGGVYSDSLTTPTPLPAGTPAPADVGQIDLTLFLSQTGNAVSGYVNLDKTLVFSVEHTIQATPIGVTPVPGQATPAPAALKIGPYVQGSFDGTTLSVQSEQVTLVVDGRTVQRQFSLTGTLKPGDANTLIGEYRETLWGYASQPLTVLGTFTLSRPLTQQSASGTSNVAPQAVADSATTRQGTAVTLNVLGNDSDANGDTLTITSVSKPQHGVASTDGSSVSYTPSSTFVGADTFSYFVSDGKGGTAVGSVTVTVTEAGSKIFLPLANR